MANPQTGNGWTMIADEIVEAFGRTGLSPYESGIVWAVIRQTYGWKQKEANISLPKFNELTGIPKPHICRTLNKLISRNILVKKKGRYSLQKDYEKWKGIRLPLPKQATPTITQTGNKALPKQVTGITRTGNGESESPNKTLTNPVPKDTVKDNIKITTDTMQQTCQDIADDILLLFEKNKTPTSKDISRETIDDTILANQGEDPYIALERAKLSIKEGILNPPGYWITLMRNKDPVSMPQKEPEIEPWNDYHTANPFAYVTEDARKLSYQLLGNKWEWVLNEVVLQANPNYDDPTTLTNEIKQKMLVLVRKYAQELKGKSK